MKKSIYELARLMCDALRMRPGGAAGEACLAKFLREYLPPGHVLTREGDDVVTRKVLGTLPITTDGQVIGEGGKVYLVADNWRDGKYIYSVTAALDLGDTDRPERFADAHEATSLMLKLKEAANPPTTGKREDV